MNDRFDNDYEDFNGHEDFTDYVSDIDTMLPKLEHMPKYLMVSQITFYFENELTTDTIQSWVKRKIIEKPDNKRYYRDQVAKIIIVHNLRAVLELVDIRALFDHLFDPTAVNSEKIMRLYYIFTNVVSSQVISESDSSDRIWQILNDSEMDEEYKSRMHKVLMIMNCAFWAGMLKRRAKKMHKKAIPIDKNNRREYP